MDWPELHIKAMRIYIMHSCLYRFHQVLKALADSEEAQIVMLKAIHELWHTHQQAIFQQLCSNLPCT